MRVCVIGNLSDTRCGFQNFTVQTVTALARAGADVVAFDGTYPQVYARREAGVESFFPADVESFDVVHLVWNAMVMNHYAGADWASLRRPLVSWWDGGPSDASCPFLDAMQSRWSDYPRDGYHYLDYPVPDWVTDRPEPSATFLVGSSSVRGDGVALLRSICERRGWAMNLPTPGTWLSLEDEVRRLARSTVNVCWYRTPPLWKNRASAPSMMLASGRPLLVNEDDLVAHLWGANDVYHGWYAKPPELEACLQEVFSDYYYGTLRMPTVSADRLSWTRGADFMLRTWQEAIDAR